MQGNPSAANWSRTPLRELIRHIVLEYHDCLRLELPALERRMTQAPAARAALRAFEEALTGNLTQQEDVLFPAIRNCEEAVDSGRPLPAEVTSAIRDLIPKMKGDQSRLVVLLHRLREQTGDDEPPELKALETDLGNHIQLEDEVLFERVLQLVSKGR